MKAFLLSDLHGHHRHLYNLGEYFAKNDEISCLICAGDILNMGQPLGYMIQFIKMLDKFGKPFFWVPGNNDFGPGYYKLKAKYPSLEGKIMEFDDQKFTGVGGSPESWAGQYQGESINDKIEIGGSIFVSHVPPPGIVTLNPYDKGDQGKTNADRPKRYRDAPVAHICGHIHRRQGIGYVGQTKIIKLGDAASGNYGIMDLKTLFVEFGRFK